MKTWLRWLAVFALVMVGSLPVLAVDASDGTNAVLAVANMVNHASSTMLPIVLGIITVLVGISVMLKFGRKGGARA